MSRAEASDITETKKANVFILGFTGFKRNIALAILSVVLLIAACVMMCFSLTSLSVDVTAVELAAVYKYNIDDPIVLCGKQFYERRQVRKDNGVTADFSSVGDKPLFKEQISVLKKHVRLLPILPRYGAFYPVNIYPAGGEYFADNEYAENRTPYEYAGRKLFSRIIELDPQTGLADARLTPDPRLTKSCRLPENIGEIAVTDHIADKFMMFGYQNDANGETCAIEKLDDLIGKTIAGLTVVGIFCTTESKEEFKEKYDRKGDEFAELSVSGEHPVTYGFVCSGFYEGYTGREFDSFDVLYFPSGDMNEDTALFDEMNIVTEDISENDYTTEYFTTRAGIEIRTRFSAFSDATAAYRDKNKLSAIFYIGLVLAILGSALFAVYMGIVCKSRKKEFAMLYASGEKKRTVISACLVQCAVVAVSAIALSLIGTGVFCAVLNGKYFLPMFVMGIAPVASVIAAGAVAFTASFVASVVRVTNPQG